METTHEATTTTHPPACTRSRPRPQPPVARRRYRATSYTTPADHHPHMPIQQFHTYDLIVDITPGALALILLAPLLPQPYAATIPPMDGILAATILLLGGFLTGRLLHATSGQLFRALARRGHIRSDDMSLKDIITDGQTLAAQSDTTDTDIDLPDTIDPTVLDTTITTLHDRMTDNPDDHPTPAPDATRRYGETLLYNNATIHHRYETLTTFYRSLTILFLGFAPIYLLYGILTAQTPLYLLAAIALLLLTRITYNRYTTFTRRRNHAFINDLHHHLT